MFFFFNKTKNQTPKCYSIYLLLYLIEIQQIYVELYAKRLKLSFISRAARLFDRQKPKRY